MCPEVKLPVLSVSNSDLTLIPLASNVSVPQIRVSKPLHLHTRPDSFTHIACNYMYGRTFSWMAVNMMLMAPCYLSRHLSAARESSQ